MEKKKKTVIWIVVIVILVGLLLLALLSSPKTSDVYTIKDQDTIPQDRCVLIDKYAIIYQTGCPHCEKVLPRIQQVEQDLNLTFKHYNLAIKADFDKFTEIKMMPSGVPAVIINCKAYLGGGYSTEDFKNFVLASQ